MENKELELSVDPVMRQGRSGYMGELSEDVG